jgi:hypothetical protein
MESFRCVCGLTAAGMGAFGSYLARPVTMLHMWFTSVMAGQLLIEDCS